MLEASHTVLQSIEPAEIKAEPTQKKANTKGKRLIYHVLENQWVFKTC